jgi:Alcohol dehydrogenase GroES-like domain
MKKDCYFPYLRPACRNFFSRSASAGWLATSPKDLCVFVPEGLNDRSLARSAWNCGKLRPVPEGRYDRGICHSDVSMLDNEWGLSKFPFVPGHEAVGTIVALGDAAKGLKIGQRVGVGWSAYSCLSCHECLSGDHHLCATNQGTMVGRHGGFSDRLRVQWTWARPLPDGLDLAKTGPLLCGGTTVFAPFLQHNLPSTARVGVIGIGGLGHMALQFANKGEASGDRSTIRSSSIFFGPLGTSDLSLRPSPNSKCFESIRPIRS